MSRIRPRFFKWLLRFCIGKKGFLTIFGIICGLMINVITIPFYKRSCNERTLTESAQSIYMPQIGGLKLYQDEYEPRVVTRDPEEVAQKMADQKPVIRPKYSAEELGIKDKLLVAVITNISVINEMGKPFNKTLSHHVNKLLFFIDITNTPTQTQYDLPVMTFPDKKFKPYQFVFVVIDYLKKTYSSLYDYFLIVDATKSMPYVNGRALVRALSQISVSHSLHFGVAVKSGSHYCALEKGIVLSSTVLSSVSESSHWCMMHASLQFSMDANLARCTLHATALPCSTVVQEKTYRSYKLEMSSDSTTDSVFNSLDDFMGKDEGPVDEKAMPFSVTGITKPLQLYAAHHYLLTKEIKILQDKLKATKNEIMRVRPSAQLLPQEHTWPAGSPTPHHPTSRFDVIPWTAFNATHVFMPDEHSNIAPLEDALLRDVTSVVLAGASHITNTSVGRMLLQGLNYGYYKIDPLRGTDYILSLQFRDSATGVLTDKIIEATRSITKPEFLYMPYTYDRIKAHLVVPVPDDSMEAALQFVDRYVHTKGMSENSTLLMVVETVNDISTNNAFRALQNACLNASTAAKTSVRLITVVPPVATAGSGMSLVAFMDQVLPSLNSSSMVALVSVHAVITPECLDRVIVNTIAGWQIYSPIMWGLYHPRTLEEKDEKYYKTLYVKANVGQFLRFDFSSISFYVSDYVAARKLSSNLFPTVDRNNYRETSRNPLSIYRLFLSYSDVHVLRAPEPNMKLPYVPVSCPPTSNVSRPVSQDKKIFTTPNELSDISLLMGETLDSNNDAFHRYVHKHYLAEDKTVGPKPIPWTLDNFKGDEYCIENLLHSFGTRSQLGKLTIEYDDTKKIKPAV